MIARGRFSVAAGDREVVKLPLTLAGRRLLPEAAEVTVRAVVSRARRAEHRAVVEADHLQGEAQGPGRPHVREPRVTARTGFTLVTGAGLAA